MKKFLLAVLVLSLTVCCFAAVVTASAATDIAVSSTPSDRGYFKYGNEYYSTCLDQNFEDSNNMTSPFVIGSWYADNFGTTATINGSIAQTLTVPDGSKAEDWRGTASFAAWKSYSKIYVQFDAYTNAKFVNIYNDGGDYTSIQWNGSTWFKEGTVLDFNAVSISNNTYRLSFFMDFSTMTDSYIMRTSGDTEHQLAFDNLVISYLDTELAPWVSDAAVTYNTKEDVNVNLDAKGREIISLKCGDEDVDVANWSYTDETLTIKAAAFAGKNEDLTFTAATEGGRVDFTVTYLASLLSVTATLVSDESINKYFDGTTDVKQTIEFNLEGVEEGHEVNVNYVAAYDSETAGTGKTITITLTLTGKDTGLYELTNDTLQITDCEIYALAEVTVSYDGEPVEKFYDGTTEVKSAIELALAGVAQGDEVNVTFDAVYASAEAGEVKIKITNVVLTGKDAYKYTLIDNSLQIDGVITERTTVTPAFNGIVEKRYDGTSYIDTKTFTLSLNGIEQGDEVTVTFSAEFDGIDAGERKVNVYNITISGKDAHKYELGSTTLQLEGYIAEMKDIAMSDDRGYYTMDGQTLLSWDFENEKVGSVAANAINGFYLSPDGGEVGDGVTQTAYIVDDNGNKVLKIEENCFNYSTQLLSSNTTGSYRTAGIYAVSYKVKPQNASIIGVLVRNAYINNATGILADFRYAVSYDADGKAVSVAKETQGWLGANQKISNASAKVDEEGWITCYFEFELTDGIVYESAYCPVVIFTGASAVNKEISAYYFDDIKYIRKSTSNKYMTIDHEYDMEGVNGEVATNTPFYTDLEDGFVYDSDWTEGVDNTVIRLDIPANNSEQVGALKNSVTDGEYKLFKGEGVHYVQFDFDMTCASFNLFSLNFFDLQCTNGDEYTFKLEVYNGIINNFKTEKAENGMTRVSFAVDMTGLDYDATYLNLKATTGSVGGEIYFDNLFVSREDYTPVVSDGKYNFVGTQDVDLDLYLKGARLLGVELDGEPIEIEKFSFDAETEVLTLDKSLFVTSNTNVGDRVIKIKTSQGDVLAKASIVDNRPNVTLDLNYTGGAVVKDYDGTTDVDNAVIDAIVEQIVMNGVAAGDDVTFTYDIAFASKNAGSTTIVISNIVLGGADAGNYVLTTTTLTVEAAINKIQLTVSGTTAANKEYDGTTAATATAGKLSGVLTGETVTVNIAAAAFNSKNVAEANKVTVTYALSGEDAANYIAPTAQVITNVSITKKTVTVTADAKTMTIGESEPTLTYKVTGLVDGETLSGTLTREQGNEAGEYDILQGTLSAGDNYELTYVGAKLTVKAAAPVTDDPVDEPKDGLSVGAIVGIAAACVAVVGAAAATAIIVIKKRRSK